MSFTWGDYFKLAEAIFPQQGDETLREARLRSVISRSYYAAYHIVRDHPKTAKGLDFTGTGDDHRRLIEHYSKHEQSEWRGIARRLDQLRDFRNTADYDDHFSGVARTAESALILTNKIIEAVTKL